MGVEFSQTIGPLLHLKLLHYWLTKDFQLSKEVSETLLQIIKTSYSQCDFDVYGGN